MISPELQNYRTRVRLRDNADPLDCLDLSRQSSSLLSPSLHPEFDGSDHENIFPFRVSPIESSSRSTLHNNTGRQAHGTWQGANIASGPLSPLTNIDQTPAQASPFTVNLLASELLTPSVGRHPVQDEMHPAPERTPSALPGKSHHSPSMQQRPADPRRESTVLFKGFTASTAETGLLEVEEIAEINGSPELMRASHSSISATKPETPNPLASQHNTASGLHQASNAGNQLVHNDAQAVRTEAAPSSDADVETADHQHSASSQACSALAPDVELQAQQESASQSQSSVSKAESHLQAGPAVKLQDPSATAAFAPALHSQTGSSQPGGIGAMRRSVGLRDSMCFFLQLEGAVEGQNGFEPEEVLKLDEVRRQSGGKASLPAVPEDDEEELLQSCADVTHQQLSPASNTPYSLHEADTTIATQQQHNNQQSWRAHSRALPEQEAAAMPGLLSPTSNMHSQADMLHQSDEFDLMPAHKGVVQQQYSTRSQEDSTQHQSGVAQSQASEMPSSRQQGHTLEQQSGLLSAQQPVQQSVLPAKKSQAGQNFQSAAAPKSPPLQQPARTSPARTAAKRPMPSRAATKAPAMKTSPVMAHAVVQSSLSLSELAGVTRSKLRQPLSLNSPPKRASRTMMPKQATNSHLVKLAATVPLPASPDGAGKLALEPTAAAALATAVAKPSHIPAPAVKASRLKKPTNTSGFFSSGRSFTGGASNSRPDFTQSLMSAAAASKAAAPTAAPGAPCLARVSAPAARAPRTAFPGLSATGPSVATSRLAAGTAQGASSSAGVDSSGAPALAHSSVSGPLGASAMYSLEAAPEQGHLQQPDLARASMPVQNRSSNSQLPPSGAPAKSGKTKGVMASMLGSVKKAVGLKSRTKDLQSDASCESPPLKPERSAVSSMGFTPSQPSRSRLPSFTALRSKASSSSSAQAQAQPQRSGCSFSRRGHPSFTREATPPLPSEVEELLRNEEMAFQGRGGGVGNSPADRAAKEASLRQSAQERHWQDYAASIH